MNPERIHLYITIPIRNDSHELASNIQCLADQEGINSEDYTVLYLVSNTKKEAQINSAVYQDNLRSCSLLRNFQQDLSQKLKYIVLDLTDIDTAPNEDSVGLARRKLIEEVINDQAKKGYTKSVIATLDADTLVDKDYIYKLQNFFTDPNISAVVGSISYRNEEEIPYLEYLYFRVYDTALALLERQPQVSAQSFAFRLESYQSVGGFRVLKGGEDIDLGMRLIEKGGVIFTDDIITHPRLRYSDRCVGNGMLLLNIHQSIIRGEPVSFLIQGENLSSDQLITRALNDIEFSTDDLDKVVDDMSRRSRRHLRSFQEIDLLFKLRLLRTIEKRMS